MIFEYLHGLFHTRDRPGPAIYSRHGKRDRYNSAYGPHLCEQAKGIPNKFTVLTAKWIDRCFFWCGLIWDIIHNDLSFVYFFSMITILLRFLISCFPLLVCSLTMSIFLSTQEVGRSGREPAAINGENRPIDKTGIFGGKKGNGSGELFRPRNPRGSAALETASLCSDLLHLGCHFLSQWRLRQLQDRPHCSEYHVLHSGRQYSWSVPLPRAWQRYRQCRLPAPR